MSTQESTRPIVASIARLGKKLQDTDKMDLIESIHNTAKGIDVFFPNGKLKKYFNLDELESDIVLGTVRKDYIACSNNSDQDNEQDWTTVGQTCDSEFNLTMLYKPIEAHAVKGFVGGAVIGIFFKALDATVVLFDVSANLGFIWLLFIIALMSQKWWLPVAVILMAIKNGVIPGAAIDSIFFTTVGVLVVGIVLGGTIGMLVGTIIGYLRVDNLPKAADATPEGRRPLFVGLVTPALVWGLLISFYLYLASPQAYTFVAK